MYSLETWHIVKGLQIVFVHAIYILIPSRTILKLELNFAEF